MPDTLPQRPTYSNGQYIGADDLNATVAYARDEAERLALSGCTWGIATGLGLVERTDTTGGVQIFIEPGIAWDGYGRPVVVLAPAPVTPDLFASLPSGSQPVWLRYNAVLTQSVAPGFLACGAGDPATRVAETYAIEVGVQKPDQRTDGIVIGGATVADPRNMLIAVDQAAPVVLDGSAPHQSFPDDTAHWLIPIGIVNYVAGVPGSFTARSPTQLMLSRTVRRYMSAVAESVMAADGVLRLRDRLTDQRTYQHGVPVSNDTLEQHASIQLADLAPDPHNKTRLLSNELVWVEGNMRVIGNARMFGTQLELRDSNGKNGAKDVAPEFLRSAAPASNPQGGQDLQICIGSSVTGTPAADRLTIGVLTTHVGAISSTAPDGALQELVVARTDGRVAIGTNAIDSYSTLANNLVVATTADTGITVVSDPAKTGNLFFADGTTKNAQRDGFVTYDHSKSELALGASAETVLVVTPKAVVIGDADPAGFASDTDRLIVASSSEGAGITISGKSGTVDTIDFANGTTAFDAGFIRYYLHSKLMSFGTNGTPQLCIDSAGRVGIGTQSPGNTDPNAQLVVASSAGDANVTIAAAAGSTSWLNFGKRGSVSYDISADRMDFSTPNTAVSIDTSGNVGIGTSTPSSLLQVYASSANPGLIVDSDSGATALWAGAGTVAVGAAGPARTTLDVQGSVGGPSAPTTPSPTQHVAIFENTDTGNANVLALVADTAETADINCHFVTFYSGSIDIGAITGTGSSAAPTVSYQSQGADYAEAVPRAQGVAPIGAMKIVGVRAGQVSLATEGADAVFVTSASPAMLAKAPSRSKRDAYETLAFLGQVPVLVDGPVRSGDLIVASGKADGMGRAVPLDEVQPEDLAMIVGRAWETVDDGSKRGVNAVVGSGVAAGVAAGALIARQAREIERLTAQLARRKPPSAG
jgi:hypothetical protein